jgi:hypothetical protein
MVDVQNKRCAADGCTTTPGFNMPGETRRLYCRQHKQAGMVNLANKRCGVDGCTTIPNYNKPGERQGLRCDRHKQDGMINVKSKRCAADGCTARPSHNRPGETRALFCAKHKQSGMTDVKHRRCLESGCTKIASYNTPGETGGLYCALHRQDGMFAVTLKRCTADGCTTIACYNKPTEAQGLYCRKHKQGEMVNVTCKRCAAAGCTTIPCFNKPGERRGLFCSKHKQRDMVNVMGKHCTTNGCATRASYGDVGLQPTRCATHRQVGQVCPPRRICEVEDCKHIATHGIRSPERCDDHQQATDRDLVLKRCVACTSPAVIADPDGMCDDCADRNTNMRLRRQRQVKAAIDTAIAAGVLPQYASYDTPSLSADGCGKERIDLSWEAGTHRVNLEVDEDQHLGRPCECDQARMVNITQAQGMPGLWVRYNPDKYKGQTATIRDRHRLNYLVATVRECLAKPPTATADYLRVVQLFFDDFSMTESPKYTSMPMI